MKKLKLNLDELIIETFATDHHETRRGTVAAYATNLCITARCQDTNLCTGAGGGGASCDGTCYATCGDVDCASYYTQCASDVGDPSCAGGDCFYTDNEPGCG